MPSLADQAAAARATYEDRAAQAEAYGASIGLNRPGEDAIAAVRSALTAAQAQTATAQAAVEQAQTAAASAQEAFDTAFNALLAAPDTGISAAVAARDTAQDALDDALDAVNDATTTLEGFLDAEAAAQALVIETENAVAIDQAAATAVGALPFLGRGPAYGRSSMTLTTMAGDQVLKLEGDCNVAAVEYDGSQLMVAGFGGHGDYEEDPKQLGWWWANLRLAVYLNGAETLVAWEPGRVHTATADIPSHGRSYIVPAGTYDRAVLDVDVHHGGWHGPEGARHQLVWWVREGHKDCYCYGLVRRGLNVALYRSDFGIRHIHKAKYEGAAQVPANDTYHLRCEFEPVANAA